MPEVGLELLGALEEHVERDEIQSIDLEIFRRRVVGVRNESRGVPLVHRRRQVREHTFHTANPVHPDEVARHLVPDRVSKHRCAGRADGQRRLHRSQSRVAYLSVRRPADIDHAPVVIVQADQHLEVAVLRQVQNVGRRAGIRAHHVEPQIGHRPEVQLDLGALRERLSVEAVQKAPVRHALNPERLTVSAEVASVVHDLPGFRAGVAIVEFATG